jgi:hypothetical protein
MKDLHNKKGTIAYVLNEAKEELFTLINTNDIRGARNKAVEIINTGNVSDKKAVVTATMVFRESKDNLFLSSLMSYMTGLKVS